MYNTRQVVLTRCWTKARINIKLTAVFQKVRQGYIGFVEELPGANTQGRTLAQTRKNLKEAIALVAQANREMLERSLRGKKVIRESINIAAA